MTRTKPVDADAAIESYLDLPYQIVLVRDADEDGNTGYVAEVAELTGCWSQGATPDEAVESVRDAMRGWISVALEDGLSVPVPAQAASASGRFVARLPRSLHAELSRRASEEGVSLNQFVVAALAGAVRWRSEASEVRSTHRVVA